MDKIKTVHQCLFCPQTFDSASDKDDHTLEHFAQETCTDCNQNLIRIGKYLYTRHNEATCIKKAPTSEEHNELCTANKSIPTMLETDPLLYEEGNTAAATMSLTLNAGESRIPEIKIEPVVGDLLVNAIELEPTICTTHESDMNIPKSVNMLNIQDEISKANLNPIVVLEDIFKKTDTLRSPHSKRQKIDHLSQSMNNYMDKLSSERSEAEMQSHKLHQSIRHLSKCNENPKRSKTLKLFECFICHKSMKNKYTVLEHLKMMHKKNCKKYKCEKCDKAYFSHSQYQDHINAVHVNSRRFVCNTCGKVCINRETLRDHGFTHIEEKLNKYKHKGRDKYFRKSCTRFDRDATVEKLNSQKKQNTCQRCGESFENMQNLMAHLSTHDVDEENLICTYEGCREHFKNQQEMSLHLKTHGAEGHACSVDGCGKLFASQSALKQHQFSKHNMDEQLPRKQAKNKRLERVQGKSQEQTELATTLYHNDIDTQTIGILLPNNDEPIASTIEPLLESDDENDVLNTGDSEQNFEFIKLEELIIEPYMDLEQQPQQIDILSTPVSSGSECHKCDDCDAVFVSEDLKKSHVLHFHTESGTMQNNLQRPIKHLHKRSTKAHKCKKCPFSSSNKSDLLNHMDTVHLKKYKTISYICNVCGKMFKTRQSLRNHTKLIHAGRKQFKCHICSEHFNVDKELTKHMQSHKKEVGSKNQRGDYLTETELKTKVSKNLIGSKCEYCDELFLLKSQMKAHVLRFHTGPETFICEICNKTFTKQLSRNRHIKYVHGAMRYKCEMCKSSFGNPSNLKRHINIVHTNTGKFKCTYDGCDKCFRTYVDRSRHEYTHTCRKPYVCDIEGCEKGFTFLQNLKIHKARGHGISTFNHS